MRSIRRIRAKVAVPAIAGLAAVAVALDDYFGSGKGGLGAGFLGLVVLGGLAAEAASGLPALRHPRTLDLAFVSGADWKWRRRHFESLLLRSGARVAALTLAAAAAMALWLHPPFADMLLLIAVPAGASLLAGLSAWMAVALIRPSRSPFPDPASLARPVNTGGSRWSIRLTARMAGSLERVFPEPWSALAGRKVRFLLRKEGDILAGALVAFGVLGAALIAGGEATYLSAGVLVAAALAFAWFRLESGLPDACLREFTPCPVPARQAYQADLFLAGLLAAGFLAYFIAAYLWVEGPRGLADPRCLQVAATVLLFAQLSAADNRRPARDANTVVVLNLGYLALAGTLFMLPAGFALAALAAALVLSHAQVEAGLRTS